MEIISSLQNPKIKNLVKLQTKAKERRQQQLVVVEGARELFIAMSNGYQPQAVYVCPEFFAKIDYPNLLEQIKPSLQTALTPEVFQKI
ncbi:MAG: RNA methyltransferase, partial [Bacteroidales bacterium]|nr:RNA methyltransferase [Bacteroidales bacterium]